jgi:hypothetical protein
VIERFRFAAAYIDRILMGDKPADLPVQGPTKYERVSEMSEHGDWRERLRRHLRERLGLLKEHREQGTREVNACDEITELALGVVEPLRNSQED